MATGVVMEPSDDLTRLHYIGIALATVVGVVHLILGAGVLATNPADLLGIAFIGAIGGFVAGIVGVLHGNERHRSQVMLFDISFTTRQVVLYVTLNWSSIFDISGAADKLAQFALFVVLFTLYRRNV